MITLRYKYDDALEFLQYCSNEELSFFVELYKNEATTTETLTSQNEYKNNYPNHLKYWELIAAELQYFGGNSIANFTRGSGVLYKEIICDICSREGIIYDKKADVAQIEKVFIFWYLKKSIKDMKFEELKAFKADFNLMQIDETKLLNEISEKLFQDKDFFQNITMHLINSLKKNILKIALPFAAQQLLKKSFGLPIGIALSVKEITDPAFRITLPSILYISYLREKYREKDLLFRHRFYPKVGSILRSELVHVFDHSGICVAENEILEIFNDNGKGSVKKVTYDEFVNSTFFRTGTAVYIAVDQRSKDIIYSEELAKNANQHLGKVREYQLTEDNCHSFVYKCITNKEFDSIVEVIKFETLTASIRVNLNNRRDVEWVVCDINPFEYKRVNNWRIEDEIL